MDAGLDHRPHGGEPSLGEQFPNDLFPPERHAGPGERSMEHQRVVVGSISGNVTVDRHPVMPKPPGPVEARYVALFKVQEGRIKQGGWIGDVDC